MAETPDGQEKTEEATGKRISETREKGNVPKSQEINSLAIFASGILILILTQNQIANVISALAKKVFGHMNEFELRPDMLQPYMFSAFVVFIKVLAPFFVILIIVGLTTNIAQFGFQFHLKPLAPKFNKLNFFKNIKGILFSTRSLVELAKNLIKLTAIVSFTYIVIKKFILDSFELAKLSIPLIAKFMIEATFSLVWKLTLAYVAIAAADFLYQKWKYRNDLKMTKQEVKEEFKQTEGDPEIKSRIRSKQMQMARSRMMKEVPKANVVITNPTHYAVALRYEMGKDSAPMVVAKGVDEVAQRIKAIAKENDVPLHEDRELARTLFSLCDIGDAIPERLFKAVAQVLAYVFQLKEKNNKSII